MVAKSRERKDEIVQTKEFGATGETKKRNKWVEWLNFSKKIKEVNGRVRQNVLSERQIDSMRFIRVENTFQVLNQLVVLSRYPEREEVATYPS